MSTALRFASRLVLVPLFAAALLATSAVGCASAPDAEEEGVAEVTGTVSEPLTTLIPFTTFADAAPINFAARAVITSRAQYVAIVGHPPPVPVDFTREWVLFYGAGTRPTGGYVASIERVGVSSWGPTLLVSTKLVSPGEDCVVTQALTNPQVFARITRPTPRPYFVRWFHRFETRDCSTPTSPMCGGIAGIPCPGAGTCVDDPSDECDPQQGGADCGGLCRCDALGLCIAGYRWDPSPAVCGCVPQ